MKFFNSFFFFVLISISSFGQNSFEPEIRAFEKQDSIQMPAKGQILLYGSSSFRLWDNWKEDLAGFQVINRGFGGSQLADALYFFDRIVLKYAPKIILFYEGDNDLAAGKTPEEIFSSFKVFAQKVKEKLPQTKLYFVAIKPSPLRINLLDKQKQTNQLIKAYCKLHQSSLGFIDIATPMLKKGNLPRMEHFKSDSLHLNQKGYDIWKKVIRKYLKK
ncbi:MAG: SGNH/GDSL hydrolase family protein [Thermoflexibacter sp.]|jgi:lysophospholipase L1-like esterase|nr:SGNH/GDSL hydrolase family protein [Thermoflexibacter sp.]